MTISILVPAAGCGARAGLGANKVLAPLLGKPLLWHTLRALTQVDYGPLHAQELLVIARPEEFAAIREAAGGLNVRTVCGGATRQDSVFAGVREAQGDFVLVHDAARPCVEAAMVAAACHAAQQHDAAIVAIPASDTVKRVVVGSGGEVLIARTVPRHEIYLAQTPQVFRRRLLLHAFESAARDGFSGTDCASLVERLGHPVAIVPGSPRNLKVTYAEDLARAEVLLTMDEHR